MPTTGDGDHDDDRQEDAPTPAASLNIGGCVPD
jgi:hypothetical protein